MKALILLLFTSTALANEIEFKGYKARILEESEKRRTLTFIRDAKTDVLVKKTPKDLCKLMGKEWKKGQVSYTEVYHTDTNTELPVKDYETFNILECKK